MGIGPIPLSEIEVYCRMFNVFDIELFVLMIVAMDSKYLEITNKEK